MSTDVEIYVWDECLDKITLSEVEHRLMSGLPDSRVPVPLHYTIEVLVLTLEKSEFFLVHAHIITGPLSVSILV